MHILIQNLSVNEFEDEAIYIEAQRGVIVGCIVEQMHAQDFLDWLNSEKWNEELWFFQGEMKDKYEQWKEHQKPCLHCGCECSHEPNRFVDDPDLGNVDITGYCDVLCASRRGFGSNQE